MKSPIALVPGRRAFAALLLSIVLAIVLAACGDGLSLVAVNPGDTPLPFKTPRVDGDDPTVASDSTGAATPESEFGTESQPAIEVAAVDASPPPDPGIVETESPTPASAADEPPPGTASVESGSGFDSADPADRAAWQLAVIEDSAARLIALRPFTVHPDLLVAGEYSDLPDLFGEEVAVGAMDTGLTSFYAVSSISALPWESEIQFVAPLFFFELVIVHDSAEGTQLFLANYGEVFLEWLVESSRNALNQTLPEILDTSMNPEVVEIPFGNSAEVTGAAVRWPTTSAGVGLTPEAYIVFATRDNVTLAFAVGNGGETWGFRLFSILEAVMARMS